MIWVETVTQVGNTDSGLGGNISHKGTIYFSVLTTVGDRNGACF